MGLDRLIKANQAKAEFDAQRKTMASSAVDQNMLDRLLKFNEQIITSTITEKLTKEFDVLATSLKDKIASLEDDKKEMSDGHGKAMTAMLEKLTAMEKMNGMLEKRILEMEAKEKESEADDVKENETLNSIKADMSSIMKRLDDSGKGMTRLAEAVAKKSQPIVQATSKAIPKFSFKPVRDQNGDIVDVIATPIGG